MPNLASLLNEDLIRKLEKECRKGTFPGVTFEHAMQFLLTDGVIPKSGLPARSFLLLEDWAKSQGNAETNYTASELKNKTGEILERVLKGDRVRIIKHGRPIAEIRRLES